MFKEKKQESFKESSVYNHSQVYLGMNTNFFLGLNRCFPRRWRWAIKRFLGQRQGFIHPQLDHIDFTTGSNVIFDVGANRGNFASTTLLRAPLSQVHCFEPNPAICKVLEDVVGTAGKHNGKPRVVVNQCGVGSEYGKTELIVNKAHYTSSFLPVSQDALKGFPETDFSESQRVVVPVITIEQYADEHNIRQAKLLKIDVQGYELEVLKGCGTFLGKIQFVFVEVELTPLYVGSPSWRQVVSFMHEWGFRPVAMGGFCLSPEGKLLQADMLFENCS